MHSCFPQAESIAGSTQPCYNPTDLGGTLKAIIGAVDEGTQQIQSNLVLMWQDFSAVSVRRDFSPVLHYEFNTTSVCVCENTS